MFGSSSSELLHTTHRNFRFLIGVELICWVLSFSMSFNLIRIMLVAYQNSVGFCLKPSCVNFKKAISSLRQPKASSVVVYFQMKLCPGTYVSRLVRSSITSDSIDHFRCIEQILANTSDDVLNNEAFVFSILALIKFYISEEIQWGKRRLRQNQFPHLDFGRFWERQSVVWPSMWCCYTDCSIISMGTS